MQKGGDTLWKIPAVGGYGYFWNYTLLSFNKKNPYIAAFTEQASKKVTEVLEELQSFPEALAAILQLCGVQREFMI